MGWTTLPWITKTVQSVGLRAQTTHPGFTKRNILRKWSSNSNICEYIKWKRNDESFCIAECEISILDLTAGSGTDYKFIESSASVESQHFRSNEVLPPRFPKNFHCATDAFLNTWTFQTSVVQQQDWLCDIPRLTETRVHCGPDETSQWHVFACFARGGGLGVALLCRFK